MDYAFRYVAIVCVPSTMVFSALTFVLGNSVGVAFSQPKVEVRSASTLGMHTKKTCNAVSVAISRRRYVSHALRYSLDILA